MQLSEGAPGAGVGAVSAALFDAQGRLSSVDHQFRPLLGLTEPSADGVASLDGLLAAVGAKLRPPRDGSGLRAGLASGPLTVEAATGPVSLAAVRLENGCQLLTATPEPHTAHRQDATGAPLLQSIIDLLPATVSVKDRERRYLFVNDAWLADSELARDDVIGQVYEELALPRVAGDSREALTAMIADRDRRVVEDGQSLIDREETYDNVAGDRRTLSSSKVPLRSPSGAIAGILSITFDISERKRAEAALARAREAAEVASAAKSRFLAQMSHELRTPLNAVIGFGQILADELFGPLGDPRYRGYARDIEQSAEFLLALIDTILDATRIESGHRRIVEETIVLDRLLGDCVTMARGAADSAGVTLSVGLTASPRAIRGDATALRQIVINLLSNAVRFTPPGGRVSVGCTETSDGTLTITVTDSGVGVPADALARVFEPFEQADPDVRRRTGGAGLGLWISRRLAELHGGALDLASSPGHGTVATLTLPPERRRPDAAAESPPKKAPPS